MANSSFALPQGAAATRAGLGLATTDTVGNSGAGGNGANGIAIITTYF